MVALFVLLTFVGFFVVDYLLRTRQAKRVGDGLVISSRAPSSPAYIQLVEPVYRTPAGVFFEPGHTWMHLEQTGHAKLGIDDFARNIIGSIDEFEAIPVGARVTKGEEFLRVRHADRTIGFKAPIDGVIEDVNTELMNRGELRGIEPYADAWLYRILPRDPSALARAMLIGAEAKSWLSREVNRLKVFLATIAPTHPALGETMRDGGIPVSGLVGYLDDPGWKMLQETFFGR
ncbi:MAG: glycine cleavage system protein H [Candidatus Krumholzibacteria bacterium]|nr:glycine cleavage system protein H [Candidatus Krumholzibacteria bacterium]